MVTGNLSQELEKSAFAKTGAGQCTRFIAGMSRAGTTWLCKSLNEHPDVVAFGETRFFARCWVPPNRDGYYDGETLARVLHGMKERILNSTIGRGRGCLLHITHKRQKQIVDETFRDVQPPLGPGEVFARFAQAMAAAEGKSIPIEKTPQHVNWVDRILTYLPESRFVVMLRDPYSFMLSYKHQGDRKDPILRRAIQRRYHPLGCAIVWRGYFRSAMVTQMQHRGRVLIVRSEEIRTNNREILEKVQEFFALTPAPLEGVSSDENTSFPSGMRPVLQPEDVFWINLLAGKEIREYGAEPRRAGFHPFRISKSVLRIPIWAIWNAIDLRSRISGGFWQYLWRWVRPGRGGRPTRAAIPMTGATNDEECGT